MRIINIFYFLLFFSCAFSQNQQKIDSLTNLYNHQTDNIKKIKISQKLFELLKHNNPKESFKYATYGLSLSKKHKSKLDEGIAYHNLAYYYRFLPNLDSTRYYYKKSYAILEKNKNMEALCKIIDSYSSFECLQGNYDFAIEISNKGYKHATEIKNSEYILMSLNRKTTIYIDNGKFEDATKENIQSLKLLDTVYPENKLGKAVAYGHMARIEMLRGNYELTLKPLNKCLELIKSIKNKPWEAVAIMEIGNAYWYLEDFDNALKYYNKSLIICKEINRYDFVSSNLTNIATIQSERGHYEDAIITLKESIEVEKKVGSLINLTIVYNTIANAYHNSNQYNEAIKNFTKGITIGDSIGAMNILREGYLGRSKSYEKVSNYNAALKDLNKYVTVQDSIFTLESAKQIEELKTQYETEKKEAAIALQKEEIKTLNQEVEISNLRKGLYAGGMFTFITISGLLFFVFKQRIKKNRLEREKQDAIYQQEIAFKKKELASQTLHLVQKNTFIQELKENLVKIKQSPELFKIEFRRLVMLLKKESAEDKDWEVFKSYFAEVHNNFDNQLKSIYVDITEKEIRLASFLRMSLSTKEIASMLNVLPDSVLKSKYRLKKKLNLNKETDLNQFLNTL